MAMFRFGLVVFALHALGVQADGGSDPGALDASVATAAPSLRADVPELDLPTSELETKGEDLNLGWTLIRTALVLGIVVSLIYLTLNVGLRKLLGIKPASSQGLVTVLERVPLDQRRSLFVVRAGSEVLLLGGSDASLSLITKLDSAEVDKAQTARAPQLTLSPMLQKLLGTKPPVAADAPQATEPDDSRKKS